MEKDIVNNTDFIAETLKENPKVLNPFKNIPAASIFRRHVSPVMILIVLENINNRLQSASIHIRSWKNSHNKKSENTSSANTSPWKIGKERESPFRIF